MFKAGSEIQSSTDGQWYRLEQALGEGGQAVVWRALRLQDGQGVAVKVMKYLDRAGQKTREIVLFGQIEEAMIGRRLEGSSHFVKVHDIFMGGDSLEVSGGLLVTVMELIEGNDLEEASAVYFAQEEEEQREPSLPWDLAFSLGVQVLEGLEEAQVIGKSRQMSNFVHRDLKPANLMLTREGLVKILDLGASKFEERHALLETVSGQLRGTPVFSSPEHLTQRHPVGVQSDLFSLGAILHYFTTRRMLLGTFDYASHIQRMAFYDPVALRLPEKNPSLPISAIEAMMAMLQAEPAQRPASPSAARAVLLRALAQGGKALWTPKQLQHWLSSLFGVRASVPMYSSYGIPRSLAAGMSTLPVMGQPSVAASASSISSRQDLVFSHAQTLETDALDTLPLLGRIETKPQNRAETATIAESHQRVIAAIPPTQTHPTESTTIAEIHAFPSGMSASVRESGQSTRLVGSESGQPARLMGSESGQSTRLMGSESGQPARLMGSESGQSTRLVGLLWMGGIALVVFGAIWFGLWGRGLRLVGSRISERPRPNHPKQTNQASLLRGQPLSAQTPTSPDSSHNTQTLLPPNSSHDTQTPTPPNPSLTAQTPTTAHPSLNKQGGAFPLPDRDEPQVPPEPRKPTGYDVSVPKRQGRKAGRSARSRRPIKAHHPSIPRDSVPVATRSAPVGVLRPSAPEVRDRPPVLRIAPVDVPKAPPRLFLEVSGHLCHLSNDEKDFGERQHYDIELSEGTHSFFCTNKSKRIAWTFQVSLKRGQVKRLRREFRMGQLLLRSEPWCAIWLPRFGMIGKSGEAIALPEGAYSLHLRKFGQDDQVKRLAVQIVAGRTQAPTVVW